MQSKTGFKQTEIGEIPEDWEIKNIQELFYVKTGTTPFTKNESYWKDGIVNWLTPADMSKTNGKLHIENSERKVSEKAVKENKVFVFDDNLLNIPGPRLVEGLKKIAETIHPESFGPVEKTLEKYDEDIEPTPSKYRYEE